MKRYFRLTVAAATGLLLVTSAMAAPLRIRGTVVEISAETLTVHTVTGNVSASLTPGTAFVSVMRSDIGHVTTGGYVGVASKSTGGALVALSVIVFPPSMKGVSEGHAVYDVLPDTTLAGGSRTASSMTNASVMAISTRKGASRVASTMTNGSVATSRSSGTERLLTLTYKGGRENILVPLTAPIVAFEPGTPTIVEPGAPVFVQADEENGKATAGLVAVGSHGLALPF